eukprot:jgi/Tetstr1/424853/TSEL_015356.t1
MEAVGDGHRFRLAYLRMQWDTQMHNGDTFALDVVQRERYLRLGIENLGSPEFAPLLELYKHRVNDANIASKRCEDISMSALCERHKIQRYGESVRNAAGMLRFVPFAVSEFGSLAPHAEAFLVELAKAR